MEVKVHIENVENLTTKTGLKVETDKDGEIVSRELITKVAFECNIKPAALSNVHRLLEAGAPVHMIIGSPQAVMDVVESEEPVFAET